MRKEILGTHILLDMTGIDFNILENVELAEKAIREAAEKCGATLLTYNYHKFQPQGLTAFAILAESHISIHTYPDKNGKLTGDLYTCGSCNPEIAARILIDYYQPEEYKLKKIKRQ